MASSPIILWQIEGGKVEAVADFIFLSSKLIVHGDCSHEIKGWLLLERKAMTNLDSILKSRDITADRGLCSRSYGFSCSRVSHVWIWELNHKEGWVPTNWCFWIVVPKKTLESSLNCKIKPVNQKEIKRERVGKIWENGIETCKISCMKRVASPGSMQDTGCLGLVHWDDPEG